MNRFQLAGQKGGRATLKKYGREHFQDLGAKGGMMMHRNNELIPYRQDDFAIVRRSTGEIIGYLSGKHKGK